MTAEPKSKSAHQSMITRRDLMQGLSATGMSLAMASFLSSSKSLGADSSEALPKRFVFVVKSSGIDKYNLVPSGVENHYLDQDGKKLGNKARLEGEFVDVALQDLELPEKLACLSKFQDRMTVIQSLSGEGFSGDHTSGYGALSCHNSERVPIAPSVDFLLGQHLSGGPYAMYGMALSGRLLESGGWKPEDTYCYPNLSAAKAGAPIAFQASPQKAFLELFGAAVAAPDELQRKLAMNGNLMDFLKDDARRVEQQLSAEGKDRFALYTQSFEELQLIENKKADLVERIKEYAPEDTSRFESMAPSVRIQSHFQLATSALMAGLTNVMTLRPDTLGAKYVELGLTNSVHALGHLQESTASNGWTGHRARMEVERLHLQCIADMAEKLEQVPEGDGSMLDNTLIVYMSCAGGDHHGGQADWPFVLVGGMANKLRMGRYLEFPKYGMPGHRTIGNLYLAFMQAAGMRSADFFGQLDANLKNLDLTGPLEELLVG